MQIDQDLPPDGSKDTFPRHHSDKKDSNSPVLYYHRPSTVSIPVYHAGLFSRISIVTYRVFKCQVDFLKVVQLGAPWTNLHIFFFSDFLTVYIFCQVTKKKDFYSITAATIAEC